MKCDEKIPEPIKWCIATAFNESGEETDIILPENGYNLYNDLVKANSIKAGGCRTAPNRFAFLIRKSITDSSEPYTLLYPSCGHIEHTLEWIRKYECNSVIILDYITGRFLSTNLDGATSYFAGEKIFGPAP